MPKMREVNKKKNAAKSTTASSEKVIVMIEIDGQQVPMTVCKPVAGPKLVTARG